MKSFGKPVSCKVRSSVEHIDTAIIGSLAVNSMGARIGDGKGYDDLDWAMLYQMGALDRSTVVVTLVDSVQILDEKVIPNYVMEPHDVPVDVIVTKKTMHHVAKRLKKPCSGVLQSLVNKKKMAELPALKFFV
ncbi:Uncharacterized protein FKW44_019799 [Caligus rogercresseyi]|uniref:Methenyltetrahydrofolate synthetase domain-containing protein n=1 Tax=Caligus rogercresseyi TaxID=217165 RepID=A0A7T8GX44_CALRO|nr:Uncharacterized protein FKW44_019799 [Caligus rogercresseyi]